MLPKCDFKDEYLNWIKSNMEVVSSASGVVRLTAPFLDADNDFIEFYIIRNGSDLILSDAGETISNLELSNFKLSQKRRAVLETIARSNGITVTENGELCVKAAIETFGLKANSLMQCMIKISDMLMLSDSNVKTLFSEDVRKYLDDNSIRYMPNVSFVGKSTFYSNYDFVIPRSKSKPERFITPINAARENIIKSTIFSWEDVKPSRGSDCILYAIVNDLDREIPSANVAALKEYGIQCIPWSQRDNVLSDLIA